MTCNEVQENLSAYIYGELNKKRVMEIHQHLSSCEMCIQEELEYRKTTRLLDRYQYEALPENFDEGFHRKLNQIEKPRKKIPGEFRRIVYAIAATIIIMIGIQFFGYRFMVSARQPVHFKDFPTTQTIFRPADQRIEPKTSLKERFIEKYLKSSKTGKTEFKRD